MFNRVSFSLEGNHSLDTLPTDKRLQRFRSGENDPGLITTISNMAVTFLWVRRGDLHNCQPIYRESGIKIIGLLGSIIM